MKKLVSMIAWTTCLAGGALLLWGGPADAAAAPTGGTTIAAAPEDNVVDADAQAPLTVCGISIALLGDATGDALGTCPPASPGPAPAPPAQGVPQPDLAGVTADITITIAGLTITLAL